MKERNKKEFFRRLRLLNKSFVALELQVIQLSNLNNELRNKFKE